MQLRGLPVATVDEARAPLIISESRPDEHGPAPYQKALEIASRLERGKHYEVTAHRDIRLTTEGQRHLHGLAEGLTGVWTSSLWRHEPVEKALSANAVLSATSTTSWPTARCRPSTSRPGG